MMKKTSYINSAPAQREEQKLFHKPGCLTLTPFIHHLFHLLAQVALLIPLAVPALAG